MGRRRGNCKAVLVTVLAVANATVTQLVLLSTFWVAMALDVQVV